MTEQNAPEWPDPMTEPCARYVEAARELLGYISFAPSLVDHLDEARERSKPALRRYYEARGRTDDLRKLEDEPKETLQSRLAEFGDLVFEMTLSRSVDNYLSYVSELLGLIFRTRPETLRSGEQVRLDFVLEHSSMDGLIDALVERRVERLSYQGMDALAKDVDEVLGFSLFPSSTELRAAVTAVETRNLIVHNRAVANRRFLARVPDVGVKLGERVRLEPEEVGDTLKLLDRAVTQTERRAAEKWGLPQPAPAPD